MTPLSPENEVPEKPRKRNVALGVVLGCLGCLALVATLLAVVLVPQVRQARASMMGRTCMANVKSLSLAGMMYADANDDRLPPAGLWMDATLQYAHARSVFRCPSRPDPRRRTFGYAMVDSLSFRQKAGIEALDRAALIFDSTWAVWNAHGGLDLLPNSARHPRGNSVGYLDGHVRQVPAKGTP